VFQIEARKRRIEVGVVEEAEAELEAGAEVGRVEDITKEAEAIARRAEAEATVGEAELKENGEVCHDHEVAVEARLFATLIVGEVPVEIKIGV